MPADPRSPVNGEKGLYSGVPAISWNPPLLFKTDDFIHTDMDGAVAGLTRVTR